MIIKKILAYLVEILPFSTIKTLFDDDNSLIVSKKGQRFLADEALMKDIFTKIEKSKKNNQHSEIMI